MNIRSIKFLLATGFLVCAIKYDLSAQNTTAVKLGQPAPPFKTSYWLRGKPITQFEKGQTYVLEFWATWCGYCIKAMPHLSELNTKYAGKVKFIGVDVLEPAVWGQDPVEANKTKVAKFISEGGGKAMNYDACRDTRDSFMVKNWITAQRLYGTKGTGIPFTTIVHNGNVVWIGHPFFNGEFEKALAQVVSNTYDVNAFMASCQMKVDSIEAAAKTAEAQRAAATKIPELEAMNKAYDNKDYAVAIKEAYTAISNNPKLNSITLVTRLNAFQGLLPNNCEEALMLIDLEKKHIEEVHDTAQTFLKAVASFFGKKEGLDKKCYDFAVEVLINVPMEHTIQVRLLQGLAYAYYHQGNKEMATRTIQNLIDRSKAIGQNPAEYEKILANLTLDKNE